MSYVMLWKTPDASIRVSYELLSCYIGCTVFSAWSYVLESVELIKHIQKIEVDHSRVIKWRLTAGARDFIGD